MYTTSQWRGRGEFCNNSPSPLTQPFLSSSLPLHWPAGHVLLCHGIPAALGTTASTFPPRSGLCPALPHINAEYYHNGLIPLPGQTEPMMTFTCHLPYLSSPEDANPRAKPSKAGTSGALHTAPRGAPGTELRRFPCSIPAQSYAGSAPFVTATNPTQHPSLPMGDVDTAPDPSPEHHSTKHPSPVPKTPFPHAFKQILPSKLPALFVSTTQTSTQSCRSSEGPVGLQRGFAWLGHSIPSPAEAAPCSFA